MSIQPPLPLTVLFQRFGIDTWFFVWLGMKELLEKAHEVVSKIEDVMSGRDTFPMILVAIAISQQVTNILSVEIFI